MRIPNNGRAVHSKVRSSSHRMYPLDDLSTSLSAELLDGSENFAQLGSVPLPSVINGPTGKARSFDGTEIMVASGSTATANVFNGEWTTEVFFRLNNVPGSTGCVLGFSGGATDAGAPNDNALFLLCVQSDLRLILIWESGGGTNHSFVTTDYIMPPFLWQKITIRKTLDGGNYDFDLFVNGHLVETFAGLTGSTGGTSGQWHIGGNYLGTAIQSGLDCAVCSVHLWDEPLSESDILDDFRRVHMLPFFSRVCARVDVEDGLGAMQDMTDFSDNDWLDSVTINDAADQPVKTGDARFIREIGNLSLANLREDSKLNLTDVTDLASYDPILQANREIEVFAARIPLGINPVTGDWQSILKGDITEVDWSGDDQTTIRFRDLGGRLLYTYMEEEFVYSDPTTPEPVEDKMQEILDDNDDAVNGANLRPLRFGSYTPVTLAFPVDPGWDVLNWTQRREPVLAALRTLAQQIGWEVRYRFNQFTGLWELRFYDPERERVDVQFALSPDDILSVGEAKVASERIRNVVRIAYPSTESTVGTPTVPTGFFVEEVGTEGLDSEGNRLPAFITVRNNDSIAKFGRRFMEISEASQSQIDTQTEALRMNLGCLYDLMEPTLNHSVDVPSLFEVELNDIGKFKANQPLYSTDQRLACVSLSHTFGDKATTKLQCRGRPTLGGKRWYQIETRNNIASPPLKKAEFSDADLTTKRLLPAVTNLYARTRQFAGGKFIKIRNDDFSIATRGDNYPPDGWINVSGSWVANSLFWELIDTQSGGRAVRWDLAGTGISITSDITAIRYSSLPLTIEATGKSGAGIASVDLAIRWYDSSKTFISTSAVPLSFGTTFETRRALAFPPGSAEFFSVTVQANSFPAFFILDRLSAFQKSHEFVSTRETSTQTISSGVWTTIIFNDESTGTNHDYGSNYDNTTGIFTAPEEGRYRFKAESTSYKPQTGPGSGGSHIHSIIRFIRNTSSIHKSEAIQPVSSNYLDVPITEDVAANVLYGDIDLNKGETVECQIWFEGSSGATQGRIHTEATNFEGKLISTD